MGGDQIVKNKDLTPDSHNRTVQVRFHGTRPGAIAGD
jgi:hypothetical protein